MRGVDLEIDGNVRDAFVRSRHPVRLRLNLFPDVIEVCVLLARLVQKLAIFCCVVVLIYKIARLFAPKKSSVAVEKVSRPMTQLPYPCPSDAEAAE
jgi:hypothetical protein